MEFIDTHCHLFWNDFDNDLHDVITHAREAGVVQMIVPATTFMTAQLASEISRRHDSVFSTAGIHPHDAGELPPDFVDHLREFAEQNHIVAIGEIGLDYHYIDYCPKEKQQAALHAQLELAGELRLPVILHNRESDEDLLAICREHQDGTLTGQFHCFTSSPEFAERVLDVGFHISFTGNVTYKKSTLDEALALVPDSRLLMETDAPFMSPVPYRGKRNEPANIPLIAERFASTRGQTVEHVAAITTANARALFRLGHVEPGK